MRLPWIMLALVTLWALAPATATWAAGTQTAAEDRVRGVSFQGRPYSSAAIWPVNDHRPELEAACGKPVLELNPDRSPEDAACIVRAMSQAGASPEAIRFFTTTKMFLTSFEPLGVVDLGVAGSPWFNMGRPNLFFLNGSPEAVSLFAVTPEDWKTDPAYVGLPTDRPGSPPFPWPEYAEFVASTDLDDGGQSIQIDYDVRDCRACPTVASMPVLFDFDPRGQLVGTQVLPPIIR